MAAPQVVDNTRVRCGLPASGPWWGPVEEVLEAVRSGLNPQEVDALVALLPRGRLSKFQPYLPPRLEAELLAERLLDVDGAREVASLERRVVEGG